MNSKNKTNTLIKQGNINVIIKWYKIIITKTIHRSRVINFKPTKNLKQLKKLFNILPPIIKYEKYSILCLTFVIYYNIIYNEETESRCIYLTWLELLMGKRPYEIYKLYD